MVELWLARHRVPIFRCSDVFGIQVLRLVFFVLATGVLLPRAVAGYYSVTYSGGGPVVIYNPNTGKTYVNYTNSGGGRGGTGGTLAGSVSCGGAIRATFDWQAAYPGEPTPPYVVLLKTASAQGDASASDGLGDPYVSGGSSGSVYELVSSPPQTFYRECNPQALSNGSGGGNAAALRVPPPIRNITIRATVGFSVTVTPIQLVVQGATPFPPSLKVIVGQRLNVYVSDPLLTSGQLASSTFSYTVSGGAPFSDYVTGPDSGTRTYLPSPARSSNITVGFFQPGADVLISCVFTPSAGPFAGTPLSLTTSLSTAGPTLRDHPDGIIGQFGGTELVPPDSATPWLQLYGASAIYPPLTKMWWAGIYVRKDVADPPNFYGSGTGTWGYAQFVMNSNYNGAPFNIGLDGYYDSSTRGWPYPYSDGMNPGTWGTANQDYYQTFVDAPGTELPYPTILYPIAGNYEIHLNTYIFYKPPDCGSGYASCFVPIYKFNWSGGDTAHSNNLLTTWSIVGPNFDTAPSGGIYSLPVPEWNMTANPVQLPQ